jgi:cbb3-type cytochrome oxidase maturation protein
MEILFVLIPVSLIIVGIALSAFVWSVHNRQYEDLDKEAYRILFDDNSTTMTTSLDRAASETEEKS